MLQAYSTMPWLRSMVQKISTDVACTTWQVFVPTDARGRAFRDVGLQRAAKHADRRAMLTKYVAQGVLRELANHPLVEMLTGGSEWFPGMVSMQLSQAHLDLIGETAWILEPNEFGMPVRGVPFPPTWIMNLPRETGGYYRIVGPGGTWDVPRKRIFFAYHPDVANPFSRGTGLAQVLADELETDEFAAKHVKDWFRNRAIPPVLISGLGVNINELQRLEEKWLSKFTRRGAGWLPHFIGSKVDVHPLSQSFQQQEMGALRDRERDMISQVFGMPPELVGRVTNSNRSTIDAADYIYQKNVIVTRAEFLRSAYQAHLVPLYDDRLVVDYVNPIEEDLEFTLKVRQAAPWSWSVDEWRKLGMSPPLAGGKGQAHALPFSIVLSRELVASPGADPAPGNLPQPVVPLSLPKPAASTRVTRDLPDDVLEGILAVLSYTVLEDAGLPVIRAAVSQFGQAAVQDAIAGSGIEIHFDLKDPRVEEHLRTWGASKMGDEVNETTKAAIRTELADGIAAGETFDDIAARVGSVFDASESRIDNIVTSELTRSTNFAIEVGMSQAGLQEKEWLCVVGDTEVSGIGVSHVAKRLYRGDLVTLRTIGGRIVTVTANHPILTRRGWVPARLVNEGDDLVQYIGDIELTAPSDRVVPHVQNVPAAIQNTFDTLNYGGASVGMMSRSMHLNHEWRDGDIDVIAFGGELSRHLEPCRDQGVRQQLLECSDTLMDSLARSGSFDENGRIDLSSAIGSDCVREHRELASSLVGSRHAYPSSLAERTEWHTDDVQRADDATSGTMPLSSEHHRGGAVGVRFGYDLCVRVDIASALCHVFDYSTATGWMIANGLVVHNSTKDDHVRDTHIALDGTIVAIDEDFVSPSGATGPFPGELGESFEDCGCRCAIITVLAERSKEMRAAQWKSIQSERAPFERKLRLALDGAFQEQRKTVIAKMREVLPKARSAAQISRREDAPSMSDVMLAILHQRQAEARPTEITVNVPAPVVNVSVPPTVVHVGAHANMPVKDQDSVKVAPIRRRRIERNSAGLIVGLVDEPVDVALPFEETVERV